MFLDCFYIENELKIFLIEIAPIALSYQFDTGNHQLVAALTRLSNRDVFLFWKKIYIYGIVCSGDISVVA